jgi:hypothetical protein
LTFSKGSTQRGQSDGANKQSIDWEEHIARRVRVYQGDHGNSHNNPILSPKNVAKRRRQCDANLAAYATNVHFAIVRLCEKSTRPYGKLGASLIWGGSNEKT